MRVNYYSYPHCCCCYSSEWKQIRAEAQQHQNGVELPIRAWAKVPRIFARLLTLQVERLAWELVISPGQIERR
jgi:hypothetical protein